MVLLFFEPAGDEVTAFALGGVADQSVLARVPAVAINCLGIEASPEEGEVADMAKVFAPCSPAGREMLGLNDHLGQLGDRFPGFIPKAIDRIEMEEAC